MTENEFFNQILIGVFIAAAFAMVLLLLINAPYGKHESDGWGPGINVRLHWFLLEFPAFAFFMWFYWQGEHSLELLPLLFLVLFEVHYIHRTFIYPLTIRVKPGAKSKIVLLLAGMPFNAANGYLNGLFISQYADHLYTSAWLTDPRFIFGILLFFAGLALNKHSDHILANLRKPGESGYKIPYGGGYRFVSCPNYLGELIQWSGFALACWSLAGLAFVVFTASNLIPRAIASHRWYRENFKDYPAGRKAVIPFIL